MTARRYRITKQRLAAAAEYASEHTYHDISGRPFVSADRASAVVAQVMQRLYGSAEVSDIGSAYWRIDDAGAALGLSMGDDET